MKSKLAVVISLVVLFSIAVIRPAAAADTYYYAIADGRLFPCTYSYMPMASGGDVLVPSQLLLSSGLGFRQYYRQSEDFYTLYGANGETLVFDLARNSSFDARWTYEGSVTRMNGVFYLPLGFVSAYFNFDYSVEPTSYGTALLIKTGSETATNKEIINSLDTQLSFAATSYRSVNNPYDPQLPQPSSLPSFQPSPSPTPSPKPPPVVFLSFDVGAENNLEDVLDILNANKLPAAFFVDDVSHEDLRRIAGNGYVLGFQLDTVSEPEETAALLDDINQTLRISTLTQTRLVSMPASAGAVSPSDETRDILEAQGYRLWEWRIDAKDHNSKVKPETAVANLLSAINSSNGGASHVRFACNESTVEILKKLIPQLKQLNASYYAISESRPPNYS